jgi:ABC-type spermidine/putrescine transport system permease subunit I
MQTRAADRIVEIEQTRVGLRKWLGERTRYSLFLILVPGVAWLLAFYLIPTVIMFRFSLLADMRGATHLTFEHYLDVFRTSIYARVVLKSARFAATTTVSLLFLCFPIAYFIAKKARRQKALLILLMVPFWTSQVLRAFAWIILLSRTGMINSLLQSLGLIAEPIQLIYNARAVSAGLIYSYIPYMVLPLYATIGKIQDELLEASADLGANRLQTLFTVTIPLALPGIVSGAALVLIASLTDVLAPGLLGGPNEEMISSVIFNVFTMGMNWPLGSAISFILFVVLIGAAMLTMAVNSRVQYEEES